MSEMEKHFLSDFVEGTQTFKPEPWYNPVGDCIMYQHADEAVIGDRIDSVLTIYRSAIDKRPIGFKIKGVRAMIERFGMDGLSIESVEDRGEITHIRVSLLLLAAYEQGPTDARRRQAYADAFDHDNLQCEIPLTA